MREYSNHLLGFIMILLVGLMIYGYWDYDRDQVEQRLYREEQTFKWEVWRARGIRCFREGYTHLYVIEDSLQTWRAESYYKECMK